MPDWDQQSDIRTEWREYRYGDDVPIWRPKFYTIFWFMAKKQVHVRRFKPALQNYYLEWHSDDTVATKPIVSLRLRHRLLNKLLMRKPPKTREELFL